MFTASRDVALEGEALGHGVLTYAVLEALAKPRPDLDVKAMDQLVVPEVERLSALLNKPQQTANKIVQNFSLGRPPSGLPPPPFERVSVKPGSYVVCSQIEVRSQPDGDKVDNLNEGGTGCTAVQVLEFYDGWTAIAKDGIKRGYVPATAVQKLN